MSNNIIVFKPPETNAAINKTEREIQYDLFTKKASISSHHFAAFMEMERMEDININSTIPSILIKSILPYCRPIIKTIPVFTVKSKTLNIFNQKASKPEEEKVEKYYSISIQLEHPIDVKYEYDTMNREKNKIHSLVMPKYETFRIIGIELPKKIIKNVDTSFLNYSNELDITDILSSGTYGLQDFQDYIYTQSRINNITPIDINLGNIYFKSDDDAKNKIKIIKNYLKYVDSFYRKNIYMLYRYTQIAPFINQIKKYENLYNIFNPEFYKKKPKVNQPISNKISKIINVRLGDTETAIDFTFTHNHIFELVHRIMLLGDTNPLSKKLMQDLDLSQTYEKTMVEFKKIHFQKKLEFAKRKAIAYNKFKITNIDNLTEAQDKIITLEFNKLEKFYSTVSKYSEDFAMADSLYWAISNGKTKLIKDRLSKIESIVKIPNDLSKLTEMLQNSSKVNIICPHIIAKAQFMIKPSQDEVTKYGKLRDFLISVFSLPVDEDGYYCKICGELIAEADEEDTMKYVLGKRVTFIIENDRLKNQIWMEVSHIMTAYVKFKNAVNYKAIITSITNTIRPEMGSIESSLVKIKSNSKDSIKDLMSIYITIYAFAIIVQMINKNYGNITFSIRHDGDKSNKNSKQSEPNESPVIESPVIESPMIESPVIESKKSPKDKKDKKTKSGGNAKTGQLRLQNIINNALFLILRIKNITINNINSISTDSIKPILIKAYKWAAKLESETTVKNETKDSSSMFLNDNIYDYIDYSINISNHYNKRNTKKNSVKDVLGRNLETIVDDFKENKSIYSTAVVPDDWGESKYKYGSFKYVIEYIKDKYYDKNSVPYSLELSELNKKYEYVKLDEKNNIKIQKRKYLRPFIKLDLLDNYMIKFNNFKPENVKIEKFYDNDGMKHKFNILLYQSANSKGVLSGAKKEYSKNDIIELYKSQEVKKINELRRMFIIDTRCSICKVLFSQVKNNSIEKSIEKIDNVKTFYKYYENRCPNGELHNFQVTIEKNKINSCSKCGITSDDVISNNKKFYDKYSHKFEKMIENKMLIEKSIIKEKHKEIAAKVKFPEWKINNSPMLEIAKMFKIKYNIWINLGLTINQKFSHIESEKINPSTNSDEETIKLRILQLNNYFLYIIRIFYNIKNYDITTFLQYELKQILQKNKIRNLREKLIDIDTSILNKFNYYRSTSDPFVTANFMLYSISATIIDIHKSLKKSEVNVAEDITMYIINSIIESEKILSDPDLTKFSSAIIATNIIDIEETVVESDNDNDDIQNESNNEESEIENDQIVDVEQGDFDIHDIDIEMDEEENLNGNPMDF